MPLFISVTLQSVRQCLNGSETMNECCPIVLCCVVNECFPVVLLSVETVSLNFRPLRNMLRF